MAKRKNNKLYVYPLLILASFIVFVIYKLAYNVFALSLPLTVNSFSAIFLEISTSFKNISEHFFPCFLLFTIGITWVLLNRVIYRRAFLQKFWIILTLIGFILVLFGGRILFILTSSYPLNLEALTFILNAVNESTLLLTAVLCFFVMFILQAFDKLYLNAK